MVTNSTKRTIHRLYDGGLDPLDIAVSVALSPDSIQRIINEYKDCDDPADIFGDDELPYEMGD